MGGTIFVACSQNSEEEINPYIKVSGLSTACMVGDELDYSNAKILYYTNLTDETPDEYPLTRDMITDFSSDTAGTRKLTATYKTHTTEMDYKIISENEFIEIYNNAHTNLMNVNNAKLSIEINTNDAATILIKDKELYSNSVGSFGSTDVWVLKENGSYYRYSKGSTHATKQKLTNYKPSDMFEVGVFPEDTITFDSTNFDEKVSNYAYQKFNNREIISFNYVGEGFVDGAIVSCRFTIKDDKFAHVVWVMDEYNSTTNISYNVANEEIPALPENVEFEVEHAQFIEIYNTARNTIMNSNQLTATMFNDGRMMNIYEGTNIFVGNNTMYKYIPNVEKSWKQKDGEIWYDYTYNMSEGTYTKKQCANQSGLITEENITNFLPQSDPMSEEALQDVTITWKKVNGKDVYFCDFMEEGNHSIEWTFENGKLIKFEVIVPTNYPENTEFEVGISMEISYSVDLSNIPSLPNVEWTEVTD